MTYTLEELSKTFLSHAKELEINRVKMIEEYPESECWKETFSLPKALHSICEELISLKGKQ